MNFKAFGLSAVAAPATALGLLALVAIPSQAVTITNCDPTLCSLGNLIESGNSIQVGDKLFSNFSFSVAGDGLVTPNTPNAITVNQLNDGGDFGIQFQSYFSALGTSANDVLIGFDVEVLDPNYLISGVSLSYNGASFGTGSTNVVETIRDENGEFLGQLDVNTGDILDFTLFQDLDDSTELFTAVKKISVRKDIGYAAFGRSLSTISFVDQRFAQTKVPTPALLPGLIGMGVAVLRKRKQSLESSSSMES